VYQVHQGLLEPEAKLVRREIGVIPDLRDLLDIPDVQELQELQEEQVEEDHLDSGEGVEQLATQVIQVSVRNQFSSYYRSLHVQRQPSIQSLIETSNSDVTNKKNV